MRKLKVEKLCKRCNTTKNIEQCFYIGKDKKGIRSISSYCKDCWKAYDKEPKRMKERSAIMERYYLKTTGRTKEERQKYFENIKPKSCKVYYNKCMITGYIHTSKEKLMYYISETGYAMYNAWTKKERQTLFSNIKNGTKVYRCCVVCDNNYITLNSTEHSINCCSKECSKEQQLKNKRKSKRERNKRLGQGRDRAKRLGALVQNIERIKIFERDKFKCWICGNKTDKNKIGLCEDNAPTLDHVQPLAHGGHHTATNLKTACFKCNAIRQHKGTFNYQLSV